MPKAVQKYLFGPFQLDVHSRVLSRRNNIVSLPPKAVDLLVDLIENKGQILSKKDLVKHFKDDSGNRSNNLTQHIYLLRKQLGKDESQNPFIETIPKRGYRFQAKVSESLQSIAVLPFRALQSGTEDELFGLSLADVVITKLANLKGLIVAPSCNVVKYKKRDQNPLSAGQELQVETVLDGKFYRSEGRIFVTAQLLRVRNSEQLWSGIFDEEAVALLDILDSISTKITQALAVKLSSDESKGIKKRVALESESYHHYLKGKYFLLKRSAEGVLSATDCFREAIKSDSSFALAHSGLAHALAASVSYLGVRPVDFYPPASAAARRALDLDCSLGEAYGILGLVAMDYEWEWDSAQNFLRKSIELSPNIAAHYQWLSMLLLVRGETERALDLIDQAMQIDALSTLVNGNLASMHYLIGNFSLALEHADKAIELESLAAQALFSKGQVLVQKQRYEEAQMIFQRICDATDNRLHIAVSLRVVALAALGERQQAESYLSLLEDQAQKTYVSPLALCIANMGMEAFDRAIIYLEKAFNDRSFGMIQIGIDPLFKPLASDKRFKKIVKRLGL